MTRLKYWYQTQPVAEKSKFRCYLSEKCGISDDTARRYLNGGANKITKELISQYTKISISDLYTQINP